MHQEPGTVCRSARGLHTAEAACALPLLSAWNHVFASIV